MTPDGNGENEVLFSVETFKSDQPDRLQDEFAEPHWTIGLGRQKFSAAILLLRTHALRSHDHACQHRFRQFP